MSFLVPTFSGGAARTGLETLQQTLNGVQLPYWSCRWASHPSALSCGGKADAWIWTLIIMDFFHPPPRHAVVWVPHLMSVICVHSELKSLPEGTGEIPRRNYATIFGFVMTLENEDLWLVAAWAVKVWHLLLLMSSNTVTPSCLIVMKVTQKPQ